MSESIDRVDLPCAAARATCSRRRRSATVSSCSTASTTPRRKVAGAAQQMAHQGDGVIAVSTRPPAMGRVMAVPSFSAPSSLTSTRFPSSFSAATRPISPPRRRTAQTERTDRNADVHSRTAPRRWTIYRARHGKSSAAQSRATTLKRRNRVISGTSRCCRARHRSLDPAPP